MSYIVKDLFVPISEYATVPKGSTLFEAVLALEKAQEEYDHTKHRHRAVLIMDNDNRVIGKLSQLNVLRAIEFGNKQMKKVEDISQFGFSQKFIQTCRQQYRTDGIPLKELCSKTAKVKVEDFMKTPSEFEYIEEDTPLDIAINQLLRGPYLSLLVTRNEQIVGILKLSDVFAAVFHEMKKNELS
jgi:CBS domain-containing protein